MTHQMKNLCGFSVLLCVEVAFGASSGGTPKMNNEVPSREMSSKLVVVVFGSSLSLALEQANIGQAAHVEALIK